MTFRYTILAFLMAGLVGGTAPAFAEAPAVPHGELTLPAVEGRFVPLSLTLLNGDADFPVLLLRKSDEGFPQFVLLVVDARNGKETWTLGEDPVVFYLLFSDAKSIQKVYLDKGFEGGGKPTGEFVTGGPEEVESLVARLSESYNLCRSMLASHRTRI